MPADSRGAPLKTLFGALVGIYVMNFDTTRKNASI